MKGKRRRTRRNNSRAIAVLNIGGQNAHAEHETKRIDEDVTLAPGDLLARVEILRIDQRAPFLSRFGALRVDDRRGRACVASSRLAKREI